MSDSAAFGFGKFIPGFDFLQQLGKAGSASGVPPLSHWVAPTVSVEEISKRIEELKAVQFWLEQNSRALAATVQALEVQKMTLHTLQGMNVSMADLAKSFAASGQTMPGAAPAAAGVHADWPMSSEGAKSGKKTAAAKPSAEKPAAAAPEKPAKPAAGEAAHERSAADKADKADTAAGAAAGMADPMLWWGALNQQFQQIAGQALQDPAQQQAMAKATHMATDFTKAAMQAASAMARQATEGVKAATDAASAARGQAPQATQASTAARKTAAKPAAQPQPATKPQAAAKPAAKKPAPAKKAAARTTGTRAAKPVAGRR